MFRRYAFNGNIEQESKYFDVVIIGSGVAGLYTALNLKNELTCAIVTKAAIEKSNSWLAQGGIAAVTTSEDRTESHFEDTMKAGAGICDPEAVNVLVNEGPNEIKKLIELEVPFDFDDDGELHVTREGGHARNRIVHCGGDATGRETVKTLDHVAENKKNIKIMDNMLLVDILTDKDNKAEGVVVFNETDKTYHMIGAGKVVISTGGAGQVFKRTTNPVGATGDGIAAGIRAGAEAKDLELIQFHPTAMYRSDDAEQFFLISEAVRGEGGILRNKYGEAFMEGVHPLKDLAPRDIVARAIVKELERTESDYVLLDITHKDREYLEKRFPTIFGECLRLGFDMSKDFIKVCPVQHFLMGGLLTDTNGKTTLENLYACGEAACTGVHGGNRLASNSLLECLVFGRRCAEDINRSFEAGTMKKPTVWPVLNQKALKKENLAPSLSEDEVEILKSKVKAVMTQKCGIIRREAEMKEALILVTEILDKVAGSIIETQKETELLNITMIAKRMLEGAIARKESIGAHYRAD